ncbi:phosphonate ABC transporter, permease protein PhnE [Paracoccus aerodenitrificans]|uniref:phosphonate ABC transporter, permease protein PhnE n=1 Tax=Paracoccus aerodenitrificans TaxID=3017781 RepID=UPI0022F0A42B|nr:phosphonate ABC transporter, permease protein PhnE [Paracoccus aerodenitrificans]WBU64376.1 phosphonate ABC transporter, permease protein PhnE [Paracoccus aerodenitrificans]
MAMAELSRPVHTAFGRRRIFSLAVPAAILAYLLYVAFAFDLAGVASRARWDNGALLLQDFWSYKTHVTRENRRGDGSVVTSIEGMRNATYAPGQEPEWVTPLADGGTEISLRGDRTVIIARDGAVTLNADGETFNIVPTAEGIETDITDPPDWVSLSDKRFMATMPEGARLTVTRSRTEIFRRSPGWELFFFDLSSPFYGKSLPQLVGLAFSGDRLEPSQSNIAAMFSDFWYNSVWHHGDVAWAIFETLLMAFLGTFGAGLISLPLAFMAASNFAPSRIIRQVFRRVFDFLRGVDALIWTIVLARAFGPGPMTGSLAILLTDTGTFGKLFSEALENVDDKPVEGLRSTGAAAVPRIRWGVIPQIAPVILSQLLYYFESNTRSATIIGAITGGGIGLLLVQAIQTQKDWEHVTYYIVLIVLLIILMDWISGRIRSRLIKGEGGSDA